MSVAALQLVALAFGLVLGLYAFEKWELKLLADLLVAAGTLTLAVFTWQSVQSAGKLEKSASDNVELTALAIQNDENRAKRDATVKVFERYNEVVVGGKIKMSGLGAASKIMEWSPKHLDKMDENKSAYFNKNKPDVNAMNNAELYAEFYSAFPIVSNAFKTFKTLIAANVLDNQLFLMLLGRHCMKAYESIVEGNKLTGALHQSDLDTLGEFAEWCREGVAGG
jgi:hypothetical protein